MILFSAFILVVGMTLLLARAVKGPTIYDRLLAANSLGTKTIMLICLIGYLSEPSYFLDTAFVYALVNFIGNLAVLKYIRKRRLA